MEHLKRNADGHLLKKPPEDVHLLRGVIPLGGGANAHVYALVHDGSNLYAGGAFTTIGGKSRKDIAKWDGSSW